MKKKLQFFCTALMSGLMLVSCGTDTNEDLTDAPYSTLTVEQHKQKIQDEGLAAMEQMDGMTQLEAVGTMAEFMSYFSMMGQQNDQMDAVASLLSPVSKLNENVLALTVGRRRVETVETLSSKFNEAAGIYTYDPSTETWTRQASTTEITFNFPIGGSLTNNGKITINHLEVLNSTNSSLNTELPVSLDVVLKKNNTALFTMSYDAAYTSEGLPSNVETVISFSEGYKFKELMKNDGKDASLDFSITKNDAVVLKAGVGANGNLSMGAISDQEIMDGDDLTTAMLDASNAFVQIGNLKLVGKVNVDDFIAVKSEVYDHEYPTSEVDMTAYCTRLNSCTKMALVYANEGKAICKASFIPREESTYYEWDNLSQTYLMTTDYEVGMQFLFSDQSSMDDSFFDEGFEDLTQAMYQFLQLIQGGMGVPR